MFAYFGAAARAVMTLAEQECRNASHYYLGTEHLLLAMSIDPAPEVAAHFAQLGLEPWKVKRAVRAAMEPPSDHPWEGVVITPRVQRVLALASTGRDADNPVTPVDIIRAIVADGGGVAAAVLANVPTAGVGRAS